jgi:hypothetical protein
MTLNPYIRLHNHTYKPEQNLVEDLTVEAIKIHGLEMYYSPRELVVRDDIFGESKYSRFNSFSMIEMYMDTTQAFEGGDTFTKFGFEIRDSVKFTVSKKRFIRETGKGRPLEGDLLFLPLNRGLFEIKFVEHENPFYQLGKLFSYQLTCELFQYSEEEFNTGVEQIDVINEETGYKLDIGLETTYGTGSFRKGDFVYQFQNGSTTGGTSGETARAKIQAIDNNRSPNKLSVTDVSGKWLFGSNQTPSYLTKSDNSIYAKISPITSRERLGILDIANNLQIQSEANSILNFDESNPFDDM